MFNIKITDLTDKHPHTFITVWMKARAIYDDSRIDETQNEV